MSHLSLIPRIQRVSGGNPPISHNKLRAVLKPFITACFEVIIRGFICLICFEMASGDGGCRRMASSLRVLLFF
jgi:hypothetical protein